MDIKTKIVGVTFEDRQKHVVTLRPGESLKLEREPNNSYDSNAVAVHNFRGNKIGHLSKEIASKLAPEIDNKVIYNAEVINVTGGSGMNYGVNIRVYCIRDGKVLSSVNERTSSSSQNNSLGCLLLGVGVFLFPLLWLILILL